MKVFMYTTKSFGKNPYVVEDLSDVILSSAGLSSGEFLDGHYNSAES